MLERAATQAADSRGSQGSKRVLTRGSGLAAHAFMCTSSRVACGPMRPTCVLVSCYPHPVAARGQVAAVHGSWMAGREMKVEKTRED